MRNEATRQRTPRLQLSREAINVPQMLNRPTNPSLQSESVKQHAESRYPNEQVHPRYMVFGML